MEIKDGSRFTVQREGITFTIEAYTDLEGDPPYPLVVEVCVDGEDVLEVSDAVFAAAEREDWVTYVEEVMAEYIAARNGLRPLHTSLAETKKGPEGP